MKNFLSGYKTKIVGGAMIVFAVVVQGWQNNDWKSAGVTALQGLGLIGLRLGLQTAVEALK